MSHSDTTSPFFPLPDGIVIASVQPTASHLVVQVACYHPSAAKQRFVAGLLEKRIEEQDLQVRKPSPLPTSSVSSPPRSLDLHPCG